MAVSPEILGLVSLGALFVGIFAGFPISFTLIFLAIVFGYIGFGKVVFYLMVLQTFIIMREPLLAAVPLFLFMGYILEQAGLMDRLFSGFRLMLASVKGSLYIAVLTTATLFAAATGIVGASVTILGVMAAPIMKKSRYDPRLSAGSIAAGGTLGMLIPPSVMLVVMGAGGRGADHRAVRGRGAAGDPAGRPLHRLRRGPVPSASGARTGHAGGGAGRFRRRDRQRALRGHHSARGADPRGSRLHPGRTRDPPPTRRRWGRWGAFVLAIAYRRLTWDRLKTAVFRTIVTSSMILLLVAASNFYGAVFARLGSATMIAEALLAFELSPTILLLLILGVIFLLGWPLEWVPIVLIVIPILLPAIEQLGVDLVWFCTLVAVCLQTAWLSPPVALSAYYIKGVVPEWDLKDIYLGMMQFMGIQVLGLLVVLFYPRIALWLPELLFRSGG